MNTELSGFIAGGSNHVTYTATPYGNGFTAELRIVKLLDGCKKSIHVDMDDLSHCADGKQQVSSPMRRLPSWLTVA